MKHDQDADIRGNSWLLPLMRFRKQNHECYSMSMRHGRYSPVLFTATVSKCLQNSNSQDLSRQMLCDKYSSD